MKVLYIGNYLDGTGWSHGICDYILAMDAIGIDVVPRAIKLNDGLYPVCDRIKELEKKAASHPDVVIQHSLPHLMDYNGKIAKNIGLYYSETSNFTHSDWPEHLNTMDEVWVVNDQMEEAALQSGVIKPIEVIPQPCDVSRYMMSYEPLPLKDHFKDKFLFYTIGEYNRRKNLVGLLKAFHTEFHEDEPVELIIKTTPVGINSLSEIQSLCDEVKTNLRIYSDINHYKKEIIIMDYCDEKTMMRLHTTGDCFVSSSYGEAWSIPAFDAMALGKTPIVSDSSGFRSYINEMTGWLVLTVEEPAFAAQNTMNHHYTSRSNWWAIQTLQLQKAMREAYENKDMKNEKAKAGIKHAHNFNHKNIGRKILEVLGS